MPRMNPEIKKRWVEALRSGKYRQGKGMLRTCDGAYCCLGVLQQLAANEDSKHYIYAGQKIPHSPLLKWAGLVPHDKPSPFYVKSRQATLEDLNDSVNLTFPEIADIIEKEF